MVVEGTYEAVARQITAQIAVPTIGIGASPTCDGQVLVCEDMLGMMSGHQPKFVKHFAEIGPQISQAAAEYAAQVKSRQFPGPGQCYGVKTES